MAENDYVAFGVAAGANVLSPAAYAALAARQSGFQGGVAPSNACNTAWRQSSVVAAMIAQFISDTLNANVVDDGNVVALEQLFEQALVVYSNAPAPASLVHGGPDTGTVNALNVAATPIVAALRPYMELITFPVYTSIAASAQSPATVTLTGGQSPVTASLLRFDGSPIQAGDIQAGYVTILVCDGVNWRLPASQFGPRAFFSGSDTGTADAIQCVTTQSFTSYFAGMIINVIKGGAPNATATPTVAANGLPAKVITRADGSSLAANDLPANQLLPMDYDGVNFRLQWPFTPTQVPKVVPAGSVTTLYIRADGSDLNNGATNTPQGAFQTIGAMAAYAASRLSFAGGVVVGQIGIPGTYALPTAWPSTIGQVNIMGVSGNVAGSVITTTGTSFSGCNVQFLGVALQNTGSGPTILAGGQGNVTLAANTTLAVLDGGIGLQTGPNGTITVDGLTYSGNSQYGFYANGGSVVIGAAPVVFSGTPSFSGALVLTSNTGLYLTISGASYTGAVSGQSYLATTNSVIQRAGTTIPGSAGDYNTGGVVN